MKNLADLRKGKGMLQEDLAGLLGVSQQTISKYERGLLEADYETLTKLATIFGVSIDYLLGVDEENKKSSSDDEVWELREMLHKRPELKILFSMTQKATKEDIEQVIRIVDALKPKEYDN